MSTHISINANASNQLSEFVSLGRNSGNNANITNDREQDNRINFDKKNSELNNDSSTVLKARNEIEANIKDEQGSQDLDEAIESIAEFMQVSIQNVNFQRDDSTDKTIIKVYDSASNELIKQFPSEEVLAIAQKIAELRQDVGMKTGILLDEKV